MPTRITYPVRPVRFVIGLIGIVISLFAASSTFAQPTQELDQDVSFPKVATESVLTSGSLTFVPADVAFYASQWRVAEQLDIFRRSKAFDSLQEQWRQNPVILWLTARLQEEILFPLGLDFHWPAELDSEELLALLWEGLSRECFVFGDRAWAEQWRLLGQLNSANRAAEWEGIMVGDTEGILAAKRVKAILADRVDELQVPGIVAGFRIRDPQSVTAQLNQLEQWARQALAREPEWLRRLERKMIGGGDFLVWNLDGSLVPWEDWLLSEFDEFDDSHDVEDRLIPRLQQKSLVLTVGQWRNYLLISLGRDTGLIAELGRTSALGTRPEFERLRPHSQQPITSVHFASQPFLEALEQGDSPWESFRSTLQGVIDSLELSSRQHQQVVELMEKLFQEMARRAPRPGNHLGFSFLSPQGYESYVYQWGMERQWDGSHPLSLLDHVGGKPIFWHVGRAGSPDVEAGWISNWVLDLFRVTDGIVTENLQGEELATYVRLRDRLLPLVQRLYDVHREVWGPAWTSREVAVVIDSRLSSRRPQDGFPEPHRPLPLPEFGIVVPIGTATAVKAGAAEYLEIAQAIINLLRRESPREFPGIELPKPIRQQTSAGELFFYTAPEWLGLDSQFALTAGLSANKLVVSLSPRTSEHLLTSHPIVRTGVHARVTQPLAAASAFHFPSLVDAASPWIEYLSMWVLQDQIREEGADDDNDLDDEDVELESTESSTGEPIQVSDELRPHLDRLYEWLKCFRGTRSVTYGEPGAWVTHGEIILTDLP